MTNRRYQGIVELDGPHLGDAATSWYKNSEQLATLILTSAEKDEKWLGIICFIASANCRIWRRQR